MKNTEIRDIDVIKTWCLSSILNFTRYFFKKKYNTKFVIGDHHIAISNALNDVLTGKITRLILNVSPRYSKTELAVKNFIAMGLALNPKAKFIHLSYSDDLVRDNSNFIQSIMSEPDYQRFFDARPISHNSRKWSTKEGGGLYAVSSAGQVTGFGAGLVDKEGNDSDFSEEMGDLISFIEKGSEFGGAIIIDDPIKPDDALSELVRSKVNHKFETTIRSRINSRKTPIIIIMQRLHKDDLCGYLERIEPDDWTVIKFPCVYTDEKGEEKALWEFKHSLQELKDLRAKNEWVFETQYMQNPKPIEGLLFPESETKYSELPDKKCWDLVVQQIDPKGEGKDYFCSGIFILANGYVYVADYIFTQDNTDITPHLVIEQIKKWNPAYCRVESNSGWSLYKNKMRDIIADLNLNTQVIGFHSKENKEIKIYNAAPVVRDKFVYLHKSNQSKEYEKTMRQKHSYLKLIKNQVDDGVDVDACAAEYFLKNRMI